MKFTKTFKKSVSIALAFAILVAGLAVADRSADAKAKSYKTYLMYADESWDVQCGMEDKNTINTKTIKNKKGAQKVTLSVQRSQLENPDAKIEKAAVFCIDVVDLMKDYKPNKVKISNVVIKVDGKKVKIKSAKLAQGYLEKNQKNNKYRLEIYNTYGTGGTKDDPCAAPEKFAFKKSLSVSFKITLK